MVMRFVLALIGAAVLLPNVSAQREFGFDNRKSSGQPYLKPDETVARMKVPDGFEVKLFAAEPMLVNPIAYTIDEKGRVWAVECFEYPSKTPPNKMPRDRIVILEDTDGDGQADKKTIWAEGKDFPVRFDMASGIEVGHGGVFLGAPPYLFFLRDTDGDNKCDKHEILLKGFGAQDTHETLNTFQWGVDGRLYGLHGIFTNSDVDGVKMNAASWRYDVRTKKFEIYAEGTSNPWGMDYRNSDGQWIVACCVIPHLFHLSSGGIYKRQAGASFNPHAYGLLPEICDHTFHKESGWAHAGLISLDTPLMPEEYRNDVIFGSIHGCMLKRNHLAPNGSTFKATKRPDFLVSGDKNVRPINLRWGPHGDIYLSDWHDVYPCHQTPADAWDYAHGRIYRIQRKGTKLGVAPDLGKMSAAELIAKLDDPNPYVWRTALRILGTREIGSDDPTLRQRIQVMATKSKLRALWLIGQLNRDPALLESVYIGGTTEVRHWAIMQMAELSPNELAKVAPKLAEWLAKESEPMVRLAFASVARHHAKNKSVLPLIHALMQRKEDATDPVIPFMTWLAYEQILAMQLDGTRKLGANDATSPNFVAKVDESNELAWLAEHAPGNAFIIDHIVEKTIRRLASAGQPAQLAECVKFIREVSDLHVRRRALDGLILALGGRQFDAPAGWKELRLALAKTSDTGVRERLDRLAVLFRETEALQKALRTALNAEQSPADRLTALRDLAIGMPKDAYEPLTKLTLDRQSALEIRIEALRTLAGYNRPELAKALLTAWNDLPPSVRAEAIGVMASRKDTAKWLLDAMAAKTVARTDVTDSAITRMRAFKDSTLDAQIEKVWGKFRETPQELNALIDKMRQQLDDSPASFARGKKVFEANCAKCHQFDGAGYEVGPKLDGAERSVEYLLANVLDPNRVIGAPYFVRTVERKNGVIESGLLIEDNEQAITIKGENAIIKRIPKTDVEEVLVVEKSVMPEGLANNMTPQDFRDLIRYVMAHPFITDVTIHAGESKTSPPIGVNGVIPLPAGNFKATLATKVRAPEALKTKLVVSAPGRVIIRLNGKEIYRGGGQDVIGLDVELNAGENSLHVDTEYEGKGRMATMRLLDPDRKLRYRDQE